MYWTVFILQQKDPSWNNISPMKYVEKWSMIARCCPKGKLHNEIYVC